MDINSLRSLNLVILLPAPKKFTLLDLLMLAPKRFTLPDPLILAPKRFTLLEALTLIFPILILPTSFIILDI